MKGTDPTSEQDWINNVQQAVNGTALGWTKEYAEALTIAQFVKAPYNGLILPGSSLTLTGHSLGGGLASYVSLKLALPAYTFNAAALSLKTIASEGIIPAKAQNPFQTIYSYYIRGELLTSIQLKFGTLLVRPGFLIPLAPPMQVLQSTPGPLQPLKLHLMDSVLLALGLSWYLSQ